MKLTKVIFLILIICKSSFGVVFSSMLSFDCCESDTEIVLNDIEEKEEDKGCCDGGSCDCLCCGHFFTQSERHDISIVTPAILSESSFTNLDSYHHQFYDMIWQPPRV